MFIFPCSLYYKPVFIIHFDVSVDRKLSSDRSLKDYRTSFSMERLFILFFYVGYLLTPSEVLDVFHCLQRRYLYTFDNQINEMHIETKDL